MANLSSCIRFAPLQRIFGQGRSELLNGIAQLSVLYEDLRIETFALTADNEEISRLDYLDKRYRIHYFLRRSIATLFEFRGALLKVYRSDEYKTATEYAKKEDQEMFKILDRAIKFFEQNHERLKSLRNAVGGHFSYKAAEYATANVESDAIGKLEIIFSPDRSGAGPKLHYAGEIAATAFAKSLPGPNERQEKLAETIRIIRDAYVHATESMHVLLIQFLWDRF